MAATTAQTSGEATIDRDLAGASQGPLADPGAWAVIAFATTSFMLGLYNTHLMGQGSLPIVFPVAFFFGGLIQILVGLLEIGRGNVFGAVVFGSYGPFWVIFGAIQVWFAKMATPSSVDAGVALFLAMWAVLTFFFFIASLRTDWILVAIFALIFIGLVLLAIGYQSGSTTWIKAGGWVTLGFAVLAWYHAAADIINFTFGRRVLSVWRITA
ncbi:MAG TPA: acetate uptake transporter [Solirubrobacteraceae bacterium]|nr:acetate uptake transporter [Solirubrobacteraceae bacterium]